MTNRLTRRHLIAVAPLPLGAAALLGLPTSAEAYDSQIEPYPGFPAQERSRVREMVLHAHSDIEAVKRLLDESPALANAAIDWGFGDWESAIGAASHMGRPDIAEALLSHGARPDLFTHAMLGHLAAVRSAVEARPGVQGTLGPHGITLLAHARAGGDGSKPVTDYLEELGGADPAASPAPTPVPLSTYTGSYRHGNGSEFALEERRGQLFFQQGEDFPRALFHAGDNVFRPVAARGVQLRFQLAGGKVSKLEIFDHALQVTATPAG